MAYGLHASALGRILLSGRIQNILFKTDNMDITAIITSILTLLAGIGVFLIACQMMSSNLEAASSDRLKVLFSKASNNKLLGVGIGALGTAAIQSSGATTVMTIGFVNAGIISLAQAATIIYGANIGTTVTAQIVALGMFGGNSVSTTIIFSAFAGLGAFLSIFSKRSTFKTTGGILAGFGLLFVGLELMSGSMKAFAAQEGVKAFLAGIGDPVLLVLIGTLLTAIIQSSSVMTSIALAMVVTGLISIDQGIYLTMGSNIGSCVVALIAGITSGTNAKRTALIHLLFNCLSSRSNTFLPSKLRSTAMARLRSVFCKAKSAMRMISRLTCETATGGVRSMLSSTYRRVNSESRGSGLSGIILFTRPTIAPVSGSMIATVTVLKKVWNIAS